MGSKLSDLLAGRRPGTPPGDAPYVVVGAGCAWAAGVIHLAVAPEHFREARVVGAFFVIVALGQLVLALLLLRGIGVKVLLAAIVSQVGIIGLYVASRTVELPFVPAHDPNHGNHLPVAGAAGNGVPTFPGSRIEPVGVLDMACLLAELVLLAALVGLLPQKARRLTTNALMVLGLMAVAARVSGLVA